MNHSIFTAHHSQAIVARLGGELDLRQVQDFFWRRWKNICTVTLVVVALTFLVLLTMTPRYTATAQVFLQPRKEKILGTEQIVSELSLDSSNVDSQVSVIQSTNLLRRVVQAERLANDPEFGAGELGLFSYLNELFKLSEGDTPDSKESGGLPRNDEIPPGVSHAIKNLRDALDVQRVNKTLVLSISVTSKDRTKATRLSNAIANAFVVDQVEARYEAAKHASVWLSERIAELRQQVRQSEEEVARFRREHNLISTSSEGKQTITEQQLSELNEKLIIARAETAERLAKYQQAAKVVSQGGDIQGIPDAVRSETISKLRDQQALVTRKEMDLSARYGARNPVLINARAERRDIDRSIANEIQRILLNLKNDYEVAEAREKSMEASLDQITGKTGLDNDVGIRLRELERINAANKTIFENFLSRSKITQEQSSLEEREARVISPATKPSKPSHPKKALILTLASVVGIILGVGGSIALDRLNPGFTTAREIEEKLGYAVLASIPRLTDKELHIDDNVIDPASYVTVRPLSRYSEAVRAVRVGIQIADVDRPPRVILVTSSIAGEGKSTLAQSLANSWAKSGEKVLLIDADLRHPSTSKSFRVERLDGLVEILSGAAAIEETVSEQNGLAILPAGRKSQNPTDLLGSDRMKRLMENLRTRYDHIVIDAPPVEPVVDAKVLSNLVDKIVFVVQWQTTHREAVARNIELFATAKKVGGVVLTLVDEGRMPRYGGYAHYGSQYHKNYYQN
jgi:succinoglycan biosynthesis transport protein ExoP